MDRPATKGPDREASTEIKALGSKSLCDSMRAERGGIMPKRFQMVALTLALAVASLSGTTPSDAQTQGSERRRDRRDDRKYA